MNITLHTEGWFDAAHHLDNYEGACARVHGHTYKVEVWVQGTELDNAGILWDFGNLKKILQTMDHQNLNDMYSTNSTAEHQCLFIYSRLKKDTPQLKFKVRVYEQLEPKRSWAECGDDLQ